MPQETLAKIGAFYERVESLFPGIRTEIGITDNLDRRHAPGGLFAVRAPYYLTFYSEQKDRYAINAGYICEQLSLYMHTLGLGSCFLGMSRAFIKERKRENLTFVIALAFGKPERILSRRSADARRLSLQKLCTYREEPGSALRELLEAARLAPSVLNLQPWRFVVADGNIHIFSKKNGFDRLQPLRDISFGAMFANIMIAADELWLDVDLIRLENISQKDFQNSQYVLSAVVRTG